MKLLSLLTLLGVAIGSKQQINLKKDDSEITLELQGLNTFVPVNQTRSYYGETTDEITRLESENLSHLRKDRFL